MTQGEDLEAETRAAVTRLAARTGRRVEECEDALATVYTTCRRLVASGKVVRKDGAPGLPSPSDLAEDLAVASAFQAARDEMAVHRAEMQTAIFAKPVEMPPVRLGLRRRG